MIHITGKLEDHFAQIPNVVFRNPKLTPRAVVVLGNILTHTERFNLTTGIIAEQTGMNRKTVAAALEDLENLGYVTRRKNPTQNGRFTSDDYEVNIWHIMQTPSSHHVQKTDTHHVQKNLDTKEYKGEQQGENARDPLTAALDDLAAKTAATNPTYPNHCPEHAHTPNPGPCHNCQRVRQHNETQQAKHDRLNRQHERQRRQQIPGCKTCNHLGRRDQYNPTTGTTHEVECHHTNHDRTEHQKAQNP